MITGILKTLTAALLIFVLIYNLTMRRHLAHGEKKRIANLKFAVVILIFYIGIITLVRFNLPDSFLIPMASIAFLILLLLRKTFFPYRVKCRSCGKSFSLKHILYFDSEYCPDCAEKETSPEESVDDIDWDSWKPTEKAVLCFIVTTNKILLIHKKTGLGKGKINGPGGRIEAGEEAINAAARETEEETGLIPENLKETGELSFQFKDGYKLHGTVFITSKFSGKMIETDEAAPFWCNLTEIPYDKMWEDDILWLPKILDGEYICGKFIFDDDLMISSEVEIR